MSRYNSPVCVESLLAGTFLVSPASCGDPTANMRPPTPIFRIFDEAKAHEFYLDYLGLIILFEHRFADTMPLYVAIGRDGCNDPLK